MEQNALRIGIRSDLHGRTEIAKINWSTAFEIGCYAVVDLGDAFTTYIDEDHQLREGQNITKETTLEAMLRNGLDKDGQPKDLARETAQEVMNSTEDISESINLIKASYNIRTQTSLNYRGIAGNAEYVWIEVLTKLGMEKEAQVLENTFFEIVTREANVEFAHPSGLLPEPEKSSSGILYLPWNSTISSINEAVEKAANSSAKKIYLMSHEYLTTGSIPKDYQSNLRPMQNEEQVVTTLDRLAETDKEIIGFFGHIGMEYPHFSQTFNHKGKAIKAYHADEQNGRLIFVDAKV